MKNTNFYHRKKTEIDVQKITVKVKLISVIVLVLFVTLVNVFNDRQTNNNQAIEKSEKLVSKVQVKE